MTQCFAVIQYIS